MQKASNARHQKELAQVREATAREMRHYYLQCLHQLVNGNSNTNSLHNDYYRQQPAYQPCTVVPPPISMAENLRPKSQEAYHSEGDICSTTAAMSTHVLRTHDSNSHVQIPAERRTKKAAVSGEKRKSTTTSSPSRKSTSASSISPSRMQMGGTHHHHKTTASSNRKAVVGRLCKNIDVISGGRHQSAHVKGGIQRSASGHSNATGSAVKKDLSGRSSTGAKRGTLSNGLVHSDGGGVRESKSVTGAKLKPSKR